MNKRILIFFHDQEIDSNSTKSISRLVASVIHELEAHYVVTFFTFKSGYTDELLSTKPVLINVKTSERLKQKFVNLFHRQKKIKEVHLKRNSLLNTIKESDTSYDLIIVLGLDDVKFLRNQFRSSIIIYWIHGISAIYNKDYLQHINKIDYLWSPTVTVYKKIVNELHPVPFLAEFQLMPNWAEDIFCVKNDERIMQIREQYNINDSAKVFIFCGGDLKLKGMFLLKRAFEAISKSTDKNIIVFVIGGAEQPEEIYNGVVRLLYIGLLHPAILSVYYNLAQFGLFPSLGGYEHAPLTLLEMIQTNVLPIASDVGGIKEMLGADYPYLVVAPHSVDEWVQKIEMLLQIDDKEKYRLLTSLHQRLKKYTRRAALPLISSMLN